MPETRKAVREAMLTALADTTYGFNPAVASIAATYGIEAFSINWAPSWSDSLIQSNISASGAESLSPLVTGIRCALYTTTSQTFPTGERAKGSPFHGSIQAHLDFWVEFGDGIEITERLTEAYADAIEDAVIRVLVDPSSHAMTLFQGPVYYNGDFACAREPVQQTEDGSVQLLPFTFLYEVQI